MEKISESKFFLVWCPEGGAPTFRHSSLYSAANEAARLARNAPGSKFFVLKVVGGKVAIDPVSDIEIDDIPL